MERPTRFRRRRQSIWHFTGLQWWVSGRGHGFGIWHGDIILIRVGQGRDCVHPGLYWGGFVSEGVDEVAAFFVGSAGPDAGR